MFRLGALCLFSLLAYAQLSSNSVTVTASRNLNIPPPDRVVFGVTLSGGSGATLDEALAAVSGAGLTLADFRGMSGGASGSGLAFPEEWTFTLSAPIDRITQTSALLGAVSQSLAKEKKFTLRAAVQGFVVSPQAQQTQDCRLADLISQARADAADLASAAGLTVGNIRALSSSVTGGASIPCLIVATFALTPGSQTEPETITIAATQTSAAALSLEYSVVLSASADPGVSLNQVLQAVRAVGVSQKDLIGVSQPIAGQLCPSPAMNCFPASNPVMWNFRYTTGKSSLNDMVAALRELRSASHPGISIAYTVTALPGAQECAVPTLVSQARKQAEAVAAAAGVRVGLVTGMSKGSAQAPGNTVSTVSLPVLSRIGDFAGGVSYAWFAPPVLTNVCSAVVHFQLLH